MKSENNSPQRSWREEYLEMKAGLSKSQIRLLKEGPTSTGTGMVAPSDAQRLQEDQRDQGTS